MGLIHIYAGDGKGKTTASVGLTVRMLGKGGKVLYVQFVKNGNSSEIKLLKTLPNLTYMNTDQYFGRFAKLNEEQKAAAKEHYTNLFLRAMAVAKDYDLVVFDELVGSYHHGVVDRDVVCYFLKDKENLPEIVLTGRNPEPELVEVADYYSEVKKIKHPYEMGVPARHGIEF